MIGTICHRPHTLHPYSANETLVATYMADIFHVVHHHRMLRILHCNFSLSASTRFRLSIATFCTSRPRRTESLQPTNQQFALSTVCRTTVSSECNCLARQHALKEPTCELRIAAAVMSPVGKFPQRLDRRRSWSSHTVCTDADLCVCVCVLHKPRAR